MHPPEEPSQRKRTRRWHEALSILKPEADPSTSPRRLQGLYEEGKRVHEIIEGKFPELDKEEARLFETGADLPFDIWYHADLYDPLNHIVYEIKPADYYVRNAATCIAQLSGYKHFTGARGATFLLYKKFYYKGTGEIGIDGPWPFAPPYLLEWKPELLSIARASDEILVKAR